MKYMAYIWNIIKKKLDIKTLLKLFEIKLNHTRHVQGCNSRVVDVTMSYQTLTNHRDHVSISWAFSEGMALKEMAFKLCKISSYTTRNITMNSESCKNDSCYVLFYLVCGMRDDLCRNRSRSLRGVNSKAGCELWKENVIFCGWELTDWLCSNVNEI